MRLVVHAAPPAKDGGTSIKSDAHPHFRFVEALRAAMQAVPEAERFQGADLVLSMRYERATSRADALNLINGVADVIQRRGNAGQAWVIDDDARIREFHYVESPGQSDSYVIEVSARDA